MTILLGHPGGNPFAFEAAVAHLEAQRLEAFCVPWMPSAATLRLLERIGPWRPLVRRLARRHVPRLLDAPLVQGRAGEILRLLQRSVGRGGEALSYEANDWLMRTMRRECRRSAVTAVHAYDDCSLWQFEEAKRLGKACIYDMPIGYYPVWDNIRSDLAHRFADWAPAGRLSSSRYVRLEQKRREMELADLVLVPCSFVENTIRRFFSDKKIAPAPYGVDLAFWTPGPAERPSGPLRFINAGQMSLRKGLPLLLEAWEKAVLRDAELELVGAWQLADSKRRALPPGVRLRPPCSSQELREHYRAADVFVFPSYFEGFGLVLLEAMACGLPAIASDATAAPDVMTESCGRLLRAGDLDALIESLRWFSEHRDSLPAMKRAARNQAEFRTWDYYRQCVTKSVAAFL